MNNHNSNLDILRGLAAIVVVCRHITGYAHDFDSTYSVHSIISSYNPPAHLSVLIFFILSGYVIQISTPPLIDKDSILSYIKKRMVRIFPIYFLAILFTYSITPSRYDFIEIVSNLFFFSVPLDNVMVVNSPLWSLQYEILYYLIFIVFSYYELHLRKSLLVLILSAGVLFGVGQIIHIHPLVTSLLTGYIFWLSGAVLAKISTMNSDRYADSRVIAMVVLIFSIHYFNPYNALLKLIELVEVDYSSYSWFQQSISFNDLIFLPFCYILIVVLTGKKILYFNLVMIMVYVMILFRITMIILFYNWQFFVKNHYVAPALLCFVSIFLWISKFNIRSKIKKFLKSFSILGDVSYATYLFHLPILFLFGMLIPTVGNQSFFYVKIASYSIVLYLFSFMLECKCQPYLKRLFLGMGLIKANLHSVDERKKNGT